MMRLSFLDELVKLGAMRPLLEKHGFLMEGPYMLSGAAVEDLAIKPDRAKSRLPLTAHLPSQVPDGQLGEVTQAKHPIDEDKVNKAGK